MKTTPTFTAKFYKLDEAKTVLEVQEWLESVNTNPESVELCVNLDAPFSWEAKVNYVSIIEGPDFYSTDCYTEAAYQRTIEGLKNLCGAKINIHTYSLSI